MRRVIPILGVTLLVVMAGCNWGTTNSGGGVVTDTTPLGLPYKIVSVQVGERLVIPVDGRTDSGEPDTITVAHLSGCVECVVDGDSISVTGTELGERLLTVSGSGSSESLTVRVYDPKALMTDGLAITYVDQFEGRWNDVGSGLPIDGGYFHPIAPAGYYALGSSGQSNYVIPNEQRAAIVVKAVDGSDALAAPTGYTKIWDAAGSADSPGSFWMPVAPEGYRALGVVAMFGNTTEPSTDDVRCVREDLVVEAKAGDPIWGCFSGTHMVAFGSWQVDPPDVPNQAGKAYLDAGTLVALTDAESSEATAPVVNPALYMLNLDLPVVTDHRNTNSAPVLDGYDEPPANSDTYLGREVAVPFEFVRDAEMEGEGELHWRVTNSPIYRVRREDTYALMYFYDNRAGTTPITHTVENTVGISQTDSETYSQKVGISISATAGCNLIGGSSATVEVSYEFGYETTSSLTVFEERTVSQAVIIAPDTAGCLWQKNTRFALLRNNEGWTEAAGGDVSMNVDSFVKGEYP